MTNFTAITNADPAYIESLYQAYKANDEQVPADYKQFFEGFDFAINGSASAETKPFSAKEIQVYNLILAYRERGHLKANTNPIRQRKDRKPALHLSDFGLEEKDLNESFEIASVVGLGKTTLKEIIYFLENTYCNKIGVEYSYIHNRTIYNWFAEKFENKKNRADFSPEKRKRILQKLDGAVILEKFLHTKYIGQKRFSLEGGESTIPAVDAIINQSAELDCEEIVIGMAHRGRLNVLANILGKTYEQIFNEFEGKYQPDLTMGDGDVKYHLGYSSQVTTFGNKSVYLKLAPNPSHLEAVNPVVQGFARSKLDTVYAENVKKVVPILIHGDASIAGQGIVYEQLQMSLLKGYKVGGIIHFVINNQIGFTTDFDDARSSNYCTGIAASVQAPVLHVNGDSIEDVVWVSELAAEFRQTFGQDIFIDMVCYRRHGHNESDDPQFTQPSMYQKISTHANPREQYVSYLSNLSADWKTVAEQWDSEFWDLLQKRLDLVKENPLPYAYQAPELAWKALQKRVSQSDVDISPDTSITKKALDVLIKNIHTMPAEFSPLSKVKKMLEKGLEQSLAGRIDWATAELLAYASLLYENKNVRFSGQDVKRGTFSHRHAVIVDQQTNEEYNRLNSSATASDVRFRIYNSLLSEFAVLGFEFGYAMANPEALVIWEAQFGDFSNGAQTMIDQFICSSESKWQRNNGIVMLLPHGYEGQGPEHSSARLERYLQACAEYNIAVTNITTPANMFHVLRRQLHRPFRKPLINMSPKSLLRHPLCISDVAELTKGGFKEIIDDASAKDSAVTRLVFCSGKLYYDLAEMREKNGIKHVAIIRMEQLYPLPKAQMTALLKKYKNAKTYVWAQEEPANMGAWYFILANWREMNWELASRKASASPATGYAKIHTSEQEEVCKKALGL